jgi:hypothetical protein
MTIGLPDLFSLSFFSFLVTELDVEGGQTKRNGGGEKEDGKKWGMGWSPDSLDGPLWTTSNFTPHFLVRAQRACSLFPDLASSNHPAT